jgi:hypothetical protein
LEAIERLAREASPEMVAILQEMARHSEDDRVRTMAATKLLEFLPKPKEESADERSFAAKLEKMAPWELREWLVGQCKEISAIQVPDGYVLSPEDEMRHGVVVAALAQAVHGIAAINGRLVDRDAFEAAAQEEDGTRGYPRHRQQPPGALAECPPAECPPDVRSPGVSTAPSEDIPQTSAKTVVKDAAYWRERKRIQRARQKAEAAGGRVVA